MSCRVLSIQVVAGVMTLAACAAAGRAQTSSTPATDSFASNSSIPIYQDAYSKACDEKNNSSPEVDGLNPLACYKQPAYQGTCSFNGNASLVRQTGNVCYYCQDEAALPQSGIVLPQDEVTPQLKGFSCLADEADQCYIGCIGNGTFTPPAGTTLLSGIPPLEGKITNQPASKPATLPTQSRAPAESNACLPYGPGGYDYCQNPIGTRLPAGCTCNRTPAPQPVAGIPPGSKGLYRAPTLTPQTPKYDYGDDPTPPNVPAFNTAMAKCLTSALPYEVQSTVASKYQKLAMTTVPKAESTRPFAQLSPISQIFVTETAMALQVQAEHDAKYGQAPYQSAETIAYMIGWLDRCLAGAGLRPMSDDQSPNVPWELYPEFIGVPPLGSPQSYYFLEGFTTSPVHPPNLMPPPYSTTGMLPLLNGDSKALPFQPAEPSTPTTTGP